MSPHLLAGIERHPRAAPGWKRAAISLVAAACVAAPGLARAGTTVITHGFEFSFSPPGWMFTMAKAILVEAGDPSDCGAGGGPVGTVFEYIPATGVWEFECGSSTPNGEIVLIFNWATESDILNEGGTQGYAEAAADALYAALRDPQLPVAFASVDLLTDPVHLIGHSRGTIVTSDCVERLAAAGIAIDQVSPLDPHPVNGTLDHPVLSLPDWLDRPPVYWSTVSFQDNYWRADGGGKFSSDFDGMSLAASDVDFDLGSKIEAEAADPPIEHSEVRAWYHGTIDQNTTSDGGAPPITIDMDTLIGGNLWYDSPARDMTGFFYSAIEGGTRPSGGQRTDPSYSPREIYNGDFEIVNSAGMFFGVGHAGWRYHGGDKSGILTGWNSADPPPGSTYYLTLLPGDSTLTHNRLYIDRSIRAVRMDFRVFTPSPDDRFRVSLVDETGTEFIGGRSTLLATGWHKIAFTIPTERRGQTQRLRLQIDGGATVTVEATVDVDNLEFLLLGVPSLPGWWGWMLALALLFATALALRRRPARA